MKPIPRFDAVVFDLLSALLDSWTVWNRAAGAASLGRAWRFRYLERTYVTGTYRPYESLVAEAAADVGLPAAAVERLWQTWDTLTPWPEARAVLDEIDVPCAIATNCSEALGHRAADRVGRSFDVTLTAERAGVYKPEAAIYRQAVSELGTTPDRTAFVAGSPFDVCGASAAGLSVFWHDRTALATPEAAAAATASAPTLSTLPSWLASEPTATNR